MTVASAIQRLVEQIIPLARDGEFPAVEQIDFAGAEDGTVLVEVHFSDHDVNGGLPVISNVGLAKCAREEFETAIVAAGIMHKVLKVLLGNVTAKVEVK